ncbi:32711_t:CDS:2 [Racocetra persica]|uniref:32711_t:CDS:1 n=1 Tax=Racocetra persica TaxID=160502 RepID=A0ACA9KB29_9GLOM|nr:32711_t:CDS:2 [Racocetra persica]
MKDNSLLPTDLFKTQKETGTSTQLSDAQDFIKFKAKYLKVAAKSVDMGSTKLNNNDNNNKESIDNYKNSNKISKTSSLSLQDQAIATNVLKFKRNIIVIYTISLV